MNFAPQNWIPVGREFWECDCQDEEYPDQKLQDYSKNGWQLISSLLKDNTLFCKFFKWNQRRLFNELWNKLKPQVSRKRPISNALSDSVDKLSTVETPASVKMPSKFYGQKKKYQREMILIDCCINDEKQHEAADFSKKTSDTVPDPEIIIEEQVELEMETSSADSSVLEFANSNAHPDEIVSDLISECTMSMKNRNIHLKKKTAENRAKNNVAAKTYQKKNRIGSHSHEKTAEILRNQKKSLTRKISTATKNLQKYKMSMLAANFIDVKFIEKHEKILQKLHIESDRITMHQQLHQALSNAFRQNNKSMLYEQYIMSLGMGYLPFTFVQHYVSYHSEHVKFFEQALGKDYSERWQQVMSCEKNYNEFFRIDVFTKKAFDDQTNFDYS